MHPDDNFFETGGHSILATRLTFQLRSELKQVRQRNLPSRSLLTWGAHERPVPPRLLCPAAPPHQDMPLNLLYQYPTVRQLALALEVSQHPGRNACGHHWGLSWSWVAQERLESGMAESNSGREQSEVIDLTTELRLDAGIAANGRAVAPQPPKSIFLTGATVGMACGWPASGEGLFSALSPARGACAVQGFLGAFLLSDLLKQSHDVQVICLVRAKNPASALERIKSNLVYVRGRPRAREESTLSCMQ